MTQGEDDAREIKSDCSGGEWGGVAKLEWVMVDGRPRHVSDFASLEPKTRPPAACPACNRPITLKLGKQKRHHAAHRSGDACAVTDGESAIHLNTKLYLASKLRGFAGTLSVSFACVGCKQSIQENWVDAWDDVEVEYRLFQRRPDLLLRAGSRPVGAIEVHHTNAVTDDKRRDLAEAGVRWVEVEASPSIYAGPTAWEAGSPLPIRASSIRTRLLCPDCVESECARARAHDDYRVRLQRAHEAEARRWDEFYSSSLARLESERRCGRVIYGLRVADSFWPSGKGFREIVFLMGDRSGPVELVSAIAGTDFKSLCRPEARDAITSLGKYPGEPVLDHLRSRARSGQGIFDSPMSWISIYKGLKEHALDTLKFWTEDLGLFDEHFDRVDEEENELGYASDPQTGELFDPPPNLRELPVAIADGFTVGFTEIVAALTKRLRGKWPRRRYEWHRLENRWFMRRENRSARWDDIVSRVLGPCCPGGRPPP